MAMTLPCCGNVFDGIVLLDDNAIVKRQKLIVIFDKLIVVGPIFRILV